MGGGSGGGNTTTTQKADPWSGVQPFLTSGYQQLYGMYQPGQGPQYFPGSTVAQSDPLMNIGSDMQMQHLNQIEGVGNTAGNTNQAMAGLSGAGAGSGLGTANSAMQQLNGYGGMSSIGGLGALNAMNGLQQAGDPANNPYFNAAVQSAIRPVTQNFQEQVLPGINQGAQEAGQFGGSRQGIAQGLAARGYTDTIGDIATNMGNSAYAQGLQAQQAAGQLGLGFAGQGLGALSSAGQLGSSLYGTGLTGQGQSQALAGSAQAALGAGGALVNQIGQQRTDMTQAQLNDQVNRWNYQQNLPYTMISDYLSMLNGAQGGSTVAQQSGGSSGNRMTGALGGAATGAALGTAIMPGIGTGIGAGAGALYGLFM